MVHTKLKATLWEGKGEEVGGVNVILALFQHTELVLFWINETESWIILTTMNFPFWN